MNALVQSQIMTLVNQMAQSLGVASEYLWAVLVKQMVAEGVGITVISSVLFLLIIVGGILAIRMLYVVSRESNHKREDELYGWGTLLVVCLVLSLISTPLLYRGVLKIVNPEYYAFERVMDFLTGSK